MLECSKCGHTMPDSEQRGEGVSVDSQCVFIDCDGIYKDER